MDAPRPNKHAAKARKHIYSSGAAGTGGKAEPTNAKNAGQPIDCPFCDRIFKQDGRLKEHMKKQHADGVNRKTGAAADALPAEGALPLTAGAAAAPDAEAAKPKYFVKSPKQMLSEWAQKQKRPMPKYKAVQVEGGMFRCRVVIPDAKDSEKDTLLWWNDGANNAEAAQQAAAVAGLHAVAGERRMDRILPEEYRTQWRELDERAVEQQERARKQAERKAAAAKRPPPPKRTLQSVFMSEDNRQLVEGLIRDSQPRRVDWEESESDDSGLTWEATNGTSIDSDHVFASASVSAQSEAGEGSRESGGETAEGSTVSKSSEVVARRLLTMGFADADIREALRLNGPGAAFSRLVDWLVLHVPESRLPKTFRPEASGSHVEVVRRDSSRGTSSRSQGLQIEQACQDVMERGYGQAEAEAALQETSGDVDVALCMLSRRVAERTATSGESQSELPSCSAEELQEERVALEAIFGDDFTEVTAESGPLLAKMSIRLPATEALRERTSMEFRFPADTRYPQEPPCIAFRNGSAAAGWLRRLTELSLIRAHDLQGEPMLWMLVEAAKEDMSTLNKNGGTATQLAREEEKGEGCRGTKDGQASGSHTVDTPRMRSSNGASTTGEERPGLPAYKESTRAAPSNAADASKHRGSVPSQAAVERESMRLSQHWQSWLHEGRYASMRQTRAALPAAKQRGQLMGAIEGPKKFAQKAKPRVAIVCGQTGCGKSTQVPQYILEDWVAKNSGGSCNVIITQPRRVAAIGLAERVAAERGEKVGGTVGYSVRLDSKQSASTRLLFCTTGVLLRRMQSDIRLAGLTHVVVDEVHERTVEGDLTLLLLRTLIADVRSDLTVVLMSATADANELAAYFSSGPLQGGKAAVSVVSIPGFTHPVRELFLEDVFEWTGEVIGAKSRYAKRKGAGRNSSAAANGSSAERRAPNFDLNGQTNTNGEGEAERSKSDESASVPPRVKESWESDDEEAADQWGDAAESDTSQREGPDSESDGRTGTGTRHELAAPHFGSRHGGTRGAREEAGAAAAGYSEWTRRSLDHVDEALLNYELVEAVVCKILEEEQRPASRYAPLLPPLPPGTPDPVQAAGAVLVFLPGMAEIRRLERQLAASQRLAAACNGRLRVLPLHGSLSGEQQRKVFDRPPPGHRKIVLSTNVAETSLTIDDVTYVVDTGRQREMGFDPNRALACLEDVWVSQAAAQQRRGRAGRARPGCCIRLFSRRTWDTMAPQQLPEVLRTALDQLCLQVKSLLPARPITSVLGDLLSPPAPAAVASSISTLVHLHALCPNPETLAPLGRHLARMPVDVRVGKMLVFSAVMGCPGPASTIAAALTGKSPFTAVAPDLREEADRAKARFAGSWKSDHLAVVAAFDGWKAAGETGGWRAQQDFCQSHFLSREALQAIDASRTDYLSCLADLGFIPRGFARGSTPGQEDFDVNALNYRVVKAVLCAGFYPNVVRVQLPEATYKETSSGAMAKDAHAREVRFYTQHAGRVFLHPASTNFSSGRFESPWLVYSEKVQTSKIFIRESSMVPAYALLLFGGEIHVAHEQQRITIDGWMQFEAPARIAVLIRELRAQLDKLLADKIENPALDVRKQRVVEAAVKLLTHDGF